MHSKNIIIGYNEIYTRLSARNAESVKICIKHFHTFVI